MTAHEQNDKQVHLDVAIDTILHLKSEVNELKKLAQTFKLTDYQVQKRDGSVFKFSPFYSHPRGYHMALWITANGFGAGKGTHTSVTISIVEGDYDSNLKWPCLGVITFTLINQLEDKNHHIMKLNLTPEDDAKPGYIQGIGGIGVGVGEFIPHCALNYNPSKNTQYLKDDTLYFRVLFEQFIQGCI